jgi:hypothetical protein
LGFKVSSLAGVELKEFDPVPEGKYLGKVSDLIYAAASKRSKQPKMDLTLDLLAAVSGGASVAPPFNNRKAFYTVSLQDSSKWNVLRTLVALGDKEEELKAQEELDIEKMDYVGRFCIVVIGQEEYEGVMRQRTRRLEPIPEGFDLKPYMAQKAATPA